TFYANDAGSAGGALYNFGNFGTCEPIVKNSIFYQNSMLGNANHKFSEVYNYNATPTISYSSMQRASTTYSTASSNYIGGGNSLFQMNPGFSDTADLDGSDNVWRTGDDGLKLRDSSALLNKGDSSVVLDFDILNASRDAIDLGAYEFVACGLQSPLATSVKVHTASQASVDNGYVCYCNSDNEILLALDTVGSGVVVSPSQVKLYIGNPSTLSYNSAGGMISNTSGGVVLERRWDVDPTVQPSSEVGVRYFYTNSEYNDIVTAMANLTNPTVISSPSQLQFYKVKGGSSATFPNPHDSGVYGIVLVNGLIADTTVWVAGIHGVQDHYADYLVSSFSGGGGGGGGGSAPLPVELIHFDATPDVNHTAQLNWITASEYNNSHFDILRSYDGVNFNTVGRVSGNGTSNRLQEYGFTDNSIASDQYMVYYRLRQVDYDGTEAFSEIRKVNFDAGLTNTVKVYPNPTRRNVTVAFDETDDAFDHTIKLLDNVGRLVRQFEVDQRITELEINDLPSGLYFMSIDTGETIKLIKSW
ncbi:MAG: T9SS type A sorting domain-containing protein, partial [Bacteroidia bacterium]|nr:T9SS type A sorting domain-containing protein [Bacteroidia bacterium]